MLLTSGSVFLLTCVLTDFLTPSIPPAFYYWLVFPWLQGLLKSHFFIVKFLCVFYTTACFVCSFHHSRIGILCLTCHRAFKVTVRFLHSKFNITTWFWHFWTKGWLTLKKTTITTKLAGGKRQFLELSFLPSLLYSITHDHTQLDYWKASVLIGTFQPINILNVSNTI